MTDKNETSSNTSGCAIVGPVQRVDESRGPWVCNSRQQMYDNPWITVSHEQVTTPAGTDGIYGLVHFKHRALGIVPLDSDMNTWLVGQYRYALDQFSWEIPMGGGGVNEPAMQAAQRELQEETGLYGGHWRELFNATVSNSVTDERSTVFMATQLLQGPQQLESTESDLTVKQLPFADALAMALQGEIADLLSIAALLAVSRLLVQQGVRI